MICALFFAFFVISGSVPTAYAGPIGFASVEEIEEAIKKGPVYAYFESVPKGIAKVKYSIQIEGIAEFSGLKIIMFKTKHKIVAGMSGSPVYYRGKLVGAMAYRSNDFTFSNTAWGYPNWGGISPISMMLKEAAGSSYGTAVSMPANFLYRGMNFKPIPLGDDSILADLAEAIHRNNSLSGSNGLPFSVSNPLSGGLVYTSGFKSQSKTSQPKKRGELSVEAGMPIVVDLMEWEDENGKISTVSALGTITYVGEDDRVFAFGHPFLNVRKVQYSFRLCEIMGTVFSESNSFKIAGPATPVMGVINYDSAYGIYGYRGLNYKDEIKRFNVEFKNNGQHLNRFWVRVASTTITPILANAVFGIIGATNGAPIPEENSVTEAETRVTVAGHEPLTRKALYSSVKTVFGIDILYLSSYDIATRNVFSDIYTPLFGSSFNLEITEFSVSFNFIFGQPGVLKLAAYKFPTKVIWQEDPVLDIVFDSEDNSVAIEKRIVVPVDWSKVEKPVYHKNTADIDKENEKIVNGLLQLYSSDNLLSTLPPQKRAEMLPEYFLNKEDFLGSFSRRMKITNQKFFGQFAVRAKSGLFDQLNDEAEEIVSRDVADEKDGWHIIPGGLEKRIRTSKESSLVFMDIDFPLVPSGYILSNMIVERFYFEVVLPD